MARYRIKQIGESSFIPQVKYSLFTPWRSLSYNEGFYTWFGDDYAYKYCILLTYEEALSTIQYYKQYLNNKKKYPKYYKI